ncbi:MAG TPA: polysaccharide deacetylase family protein [Terriglobales bacterium]|nr:polysaccharide deacetylase family protein [Terriglobales bacterium]
MNSPGRVFLMFHELQLPGRSLCRLEEGYARYCVAEGDFRAQLRRMKERGLRGISVSQALSQPERPGTVITFDDGCETDLISAAPALQQYSFDATFYITIEFIGQSGFLSVSQLRALSDLGFEIGSHSRTHAYLPDLPLTDAQRELQESKDSLEQIIGRPVKHFSCPGGRWNATLAALARDIGYTSVATSRRAINPPGADPFSLARIGVMRGTNLSRFDDICQGKGLRLARCRDFGTALAKRTLGNVAYDKFRSVLLGDS